MIDDISVYDTWGFPDLLMVFRTNGFCDSDLAASFARRALEVFLTILEIHGLSEAAMVEWGWYLGTNK